MDDLNEDDMALIHQLYPGVYTQSAPPQEAKPRRRRKKSREHESGGGEGRGKRKLSAEQVEQLERNFGDEHKLESERKDRLAAELGLDPRQVAVWFQNRRARWKSKKLEVEYAKLKSLHENAIVEKCRLHSEVLKLEEQLSKAKMEIERLSARADRGLSGNSPCSSVTADATDNPIWGDFGVADHESDDQDVLYYLPHSAYQMGMEWFDLFK